MYLWAFQLYVQQKRKEGDITFNDEQGKHFNQPKKYLVEDREIIKNYKHLLLLYNSNVHVTDNNEAYIGIWNEIGLGNRRNYLMSIETHEFWYFSKV